MTVRLEDFLALAGQGKDVVARAAELGARLVAIDTERKSIVAELAELGIGAASPDTPVSPAPAPEIAPRLNAAKRCAECGEAATMQVGGDWYCATHGEAL